MKRVISLWLPRFATDRLQQRQSRTPVRNRRQTEGQTPHRSRANSPDESPLATVTAVHGGQRIAAANDAARNQGISPGMALADARALHPGLGVRQMAPAGDLETLKRLARAAMRYTPWTAIDPLGDKAGNGFGSLGGDAGLWLDVSGCAHLFGGEAALLADLTGRFENHGFHARAAMAPMPGAAWALARFGEASAPILVPGDIREALAPLPVAALRIAGRAAEALERVGLRRIDDLLQMPRGPLARRFGRAVLERLDQALGKTDEPISPQPIQPLIHARRVFAEPVGRSEDIEAATVGLLSHIAGQLETTGQGARQMDLTLYRVDNSTQQVRIGTARPVRDASHLARLLRDKMEDFDAGFGVEVITLTATETALLAHRQGELPDNSTSNLSFTDTEESAGRLIDRLAGRLGPASVTRLRASASHLPERASRTIPVFKEKDGDTAPNAPDSADLWRGAPRRGPRPIRLLAQPMAIDVMAPVPDGPPVMFRWRRRQHKVTNAEGPERIAPEWWRHSGRLPPGATTLEHGTRDYYRIEDESGKRYWLYREGLYRPDRPPRWYLHGFFA